MVRNRVVISGAIAQKPGYGGHTWALLQYVLGFRDLGWDVLFLDALASASCRDAAGNACAPSDSVNLAYVKALVDRYDLSGRYALTIDGGREWFGLERTAVVDRLRTSAFLINIMGFLADPELLAAAPRRVFLDIDPGFGQMWRELHLHDAFAGHDTFVTIGEKIGDATCSVPTCDLQWITTPQPVVLKYWPPAPPRPTPFTFTSVASWRGAYAPVDFGGRTYGLRVHEFRKFLDLPSRTGLRFELALDIHEGDARDRQRLMEHGWRLRRTSVAAGPDAYQAYIHNSAAEFMIAKNMYVQTASGWMSDRSLCYLASGRPVLAQDCGVRADYRVGRGLVLFTSPEEAADGARSIVADYDAHARGARALAETHFDSRLVLTRLSDRLG